MSKVRILLRWCVLVTVVFALAGCAASQGGDPGGGSGKTGLTNPCGGGRGTADRNAPIVCVDDSGETLSVHPDPVEAHSVGEAGRQPVMIHWWTRSGGNVLNLEIQPGCVTDVTCRGSHCSARTLPSDARKQCKYDVWTDKHARLDPEVVITPCC